MLTIGTTSVYSGLSVAVALAAVASSGGGNLVSGHELLARGNDNVQSAGNDDFAPPARALLESGGIDIDSSPSLVMAADTAAVQGSNNGNLRRLPPTSDRALKQQCCLGQYESGGDVSGGIEDERVAAFSQKIADLKASIATDIAALETNAQPGDGEHHEGLVGTITGGISTAGAGARAAASGCWTRVLTKTYYFPFWRV